MSTPNNTNPPDSDPLKRKGIRESLVMAAAASLFFISWGIFANWEHGRRAITQVALTQGTISFVSTFLSTEVLRRLYLVFKRVGINVLFTIPIGFTLINGSIYSAHLIAGTPEILLTMLPGVLISVFFCSAYTYRLRLAYTINKE
tara:strand:- start:568 stop:1002 length:435 start_codon:yes stop_codon:yes gene_type:complete